MENVSPSLGYPTGGGNGGEIDMEEGEILEEEGIGEISKKKLEFDGESDEIKSGPSRDNNVVCSIRPFTPLRLFPVC